MNKADAKTRLKNSSSMLANTPTEMLDQEFAQTDAGGFIGFHRNCHILAELNHRGESRPQMRVGMYILYREISSGLILPEFFQRFVGAQVMTYAKTLPHEQQQALVKSDTVDTVELNTEGKIVPVEKRLVHLSKRQHEIIFGPEGMRSVKEQRKVFAARKPKPIVRRSITAEEVRADLKTEELVCGQLRIPISAIYAAVNQMGFEIRRIGLR